MECPAVNNNPTGYIKPRRYTPEQLGKLIDEYIAERKKQEKPISRVGLAVHIGMCKDSITDMDKIEAYSEHIKKIDTASEAYSIDCLYSGRVPAGPIFFLKNVHGWTDKQEINHTGTIDHRLLPPDDSQLLRLLDKARQHEQAMATIEGSAEVVSVEPIANE
jgi:hypothetical protein